MSKKELMDAMISVTEKKKAECEKRLCELDPYAKNERAALSMQKNLYKIAIEGINFAGSGEDFSVTFQRRFNNMLAENDTAREIYDTAEENEKPTLAVYIHEVLFLRTNLLSRFHSDAENSEEPQKIIEAKIKTGIINDLLCEYRKCYLNSGGRKELAF